MLYAFISFVLFGLFHFYPISFYYIFYIHFMYFPSVRKSTWFHSDLISFLVVCPTAIPARPNGNTIGNNIFSRYAPSPVIPNLILTDSSALPLRQLCWIRYHKWGGVARKDIVPNGITVGPRRNCCGTEDEERDEVAVKSGWFPNWGKVHEVYNKIRSDRNGISQIKQMR